MPGIRRRRQRFSVAVRLWWRRRRTYTAALERELSRYRAKCARLEADLTLERSGRLADALALYEMRVDDAKAVADAFARMTTRRPVHADEKGAPPAPAESIHETEDEAKQRERNARVNVRVAYANHHKMDYGTVLEKIRSGELTTKQIMAEMGSAGTADLVQ